MGLVVQRAVYHEGKLFLLCRELTAWESGPQLVPYESISDRMNAPLDSQQRIVATRACERAAALKRELEGNG